MHRVWCGLAFERLCLAHIQQIKAKLGITGILSNVYAWRKEGNESGPGTQIDLLIDRNDQVINLCEMKYSLSAYSLTADYEQQLRQKKSIFIEQTQTHKAVHLTFVSTFGLLPNAYSGSIQQEVVLDDLFCS